jgi:F-type H+-transporting ATPase subunit b
VSADIGVIIAQTVGSWQLAVGSQQSPFTIRHSLVIVNCQPSTVNCQPSTSMVEQVQQAAGLAGIVGPLGVDVKLFIAQLINMSVVIFVMWRWVYKPLLKVMDERTGKIEKGLKQAEQAAATLIGAEKEKEVALVEARRKAKEIVDEASRIAGEEREAIIKKARGEVEHLVSQGKNQLADEKSRILREVRVEAADLVALAVENLVREKIDARKDEALIRSALAQAEQQ